MDHPQSEVGEKHGGPEQSPGGNYYEEPPPQGRGCLFYGCLAGGVAVLLGLVLVGGLAYMGWYYYSKLIDDWTATAPTELPAVEASEEQIADVEARWKVFKDAMDKGEEAEITLNQDDVNILVSREPEMKGHVYFTLEEEKAKVELSFDLGKTGAPRTKGRFFNAKGTVTAEVGPSGRMDIRLLDIEVRGKPLPKEFAQGLGAENLADAMVKNKDNQEFRDKIERVEVKDSLVHIKTRPKLKPTVEKSEPKGDQPPDEAKDAPSTEPAKEVPSTEPSPPAKEEGEPKKAA